MPAPEEEPSFEAVFDELCREFKRAGVPGETNAQLGAALLELILQRERRRYRVDYPSSEQAAVDRQTFARLSDQMELGSEFAREEAVFRRLAKDPSEAMRYLEEATADESAAQSQRAKVPRKGSHDSLTRLIDEIMEVDPDRSTDDVLEELHRTPGVQVTADEIRNDQDAASMPRTGFKHRVSRARKRFREQKSREPG